MSCFTNEELTDLRSRVICVSGEEVERLIDAYKAALDRERDLAKAVTALLGAFTTAPEGDSPAWKGPACTQARAAIRKHKEAVGE